MRVSPLRLRLMFPQSAELAGVVEISRDEVAEIPVTGVAGGGDAVPTPDPVDDVHPMVVDEVEVDGAAWPEILEGVRLLKRASTTVAGAISISRSVALQMDVLGRNAPLFFWGVSGCRQHG